jgi:hypothetical protein
MNTESSSYVHTFELAKISSAAVTYHLRSVGARGWALATVNDQTGELSIKSDWGSWSHRWNVDHLGSPTLTHFIADCAGCDYLADKLTSREERTCFDVDATIKAMRSIICARRLEQGRAWNAYYQDEDQRWDLAGDAPTWAETKRVWCCGRMEQWPLTRSLARELFDDVGARRSELHSAVTVDGFITAFRRIDGSEWITDEPWEYLKYVPSRTYVQLLRGILPAVVAACAVHVQNAVTPAVEHES